MAAYLAAICFDLNRRPGRLQLSTSSLIPCPARAISIKSVLSAAGHNHRWWCNDPHGPGSCERTYTSFRRDHPVGLRRTFVSLLDRTPRSYICPLAGYTVLLAGLPLVNAP